MRHKTALLSVTFVLISGCNKNPEFSCDNPTVKRQVVSMLSNHVNESVSKPGYLNGILSSLEQMQAMAGMDGILELEEDYKNITFSLKDIRTSKQDKDLGNYECKANLVSQKGVNREAEVEIYYTSETTSGGKDAYVKVNKISDYNVGVLASVLVKEKELVEKTTRGELSYGTLDSSIGDFTFLSNTAIGKSIFSECEVMESCEVKAMVEENEYGDIIRKIINVKKL